MEGLLAIYAIVALTGFIGGAFLALMEGYDRGARRRAVRFALASLIWPLMIFPLIKFALGSDDD